MRAIDKGATAKKTVDSFALMARDGGTPRQTEVHHVSNFFHEFFIINRMSHLRIIAYTLLVILAAIPKRVQPQPWTFFKYSPHGLF